MSRETDSKRGSRYEDNWSLGRAIERWLTVRRLLRPFGRAGLEKDTPRETELTDGLVRIDSSYDEVVLVTFHKLKQYKTELMIMNTYTIMKSVSGYKRSLMLKKG